MGIEIHWHRKQIFPRNTPFPYQDLNMFFTAMVNEYKDRLANDPANTPFNILALYHRINGLTQIVELFPKDDQLFMLESFVRQWIVKYTPDYYVRIHTCMIRSSKKEVIIFVGSWQGGHKVTKNI